ncbi:MAG: T9SS type B sorting domain-containing protein [Candidatus Zixiibacteriota bacterium]
MNKRLFLLILLIMPLLILAIQNDESLEFYSNEGLQSIMSPMDCPSVFDISAIEETFCDGVNIVTVCYSIFDADGDDINVEFNLEHAGTTVVPTTIVDDVPGFPGPNLGLLPSGDYCFNWYMSTDAPGMESCDFDFHINIDNETADILNVTDSFSIVDAEGITWDGTALWVTGSYWTGESTMVYRIDPISYDTLHSCVLHRDGYFADACWHDGNIYTIGANGGGTGSGVAGNIYVFDPYTCALIDSSDSPIFTGRFGQGIEYYDGWLWCNNTLGEVWRVDPITLTPNPSTPYMNVSDIYAATHGGAELFPDGLPDAIEFELGSMWFLKNPDSGINNILFRFDLDGNFIQEYVLPSSGSHGPEGLTFDGSCFWYTDHSDDQVYRVCLGGCRDSITDYDVCLDSRNPDVELYCPPFDSITVGENIHLTWDIDDMNFTEPCSIRLSGCGYDTSFTGSFSTADFDLPYAFATCPEVWIHLIAQDTYCNWGSDSCMIYPRAIWEVTHRTPPPPDSGYIACEGQQIIFRIDHTCPIDWGASELIIDGSDSYTLTDPEITFDDSIMTFAPAADYWPSGSHTFRFIVSDDCGNSYDETFEVDFDFERPDIYGFAPVDTFLSLDSVQIGFVLQDNFSGIGDVSVTINSDCGTVIYNMLDLTSMPTALGDSFTTPNYYCEGTNTICVTAEDSPYICGPNDTTFCWEYIVPPPGEVIAEVAVPIDDNGDGRVITNCENQYIAWYIDSDYEIEPTTLSVTVCGIDYFYPDPHLDYRNDTLYYIPDASWSHGDSCGFCINTAEDIIGTELTEPACGYLVYDGTPPELVSRIPAIDSIFGTSETFDAEFMEEICDEAFIDSIWVTTSISRIAFRADTFPFTVDSFVDGDEVRVCAYVHDECADYCGINSGRICWNYEVMTGGPTGYVIEPIDENGDGRVITACTTQVITIALYDEYGMDPFGDFRLFIEELDRYFREEDLDITMGGSGESLYVSLDIGVYGEDWLDIDGGYVHFTLDSAFDVYGLGLIEPIRDSFLVDFSPPELSDMSPTSSVFDSTVTITATAIDDVCPTALIDSLVATVYPGSREIRIRASTGDVVGLENGDSIHVCAYAHDQCHDYCGDHQTEICWSFGAHLGDINAEVVYPVDENHDMRVISTCPDQPIAWYIDHSDDMVLSEFYVNVNGRLYNYPSHLEFIDDTLYFSPSMPYSHGDTVEFYVDHMEDDIRTMADSIGYGRVIIDLSPPDINIISGPEDGDIINSSSISGLFHAVDDYCTSEMMDSIRITSSEGRDTLLTTDSYNLDGLVDGEIIQVCAYANQSCQDYSCIDTTGQNCLEFEVMLGSISADIILPIDENSDGRVITTCDEQQIIWEIGHDYSLVESTIVVTVDGERYEFPEHLTLDTGLLTFIPTEPFMDGDSIYFCLDSVMDESGVWLPSPICGSFIVDLEPPIIYNTSGPMPGGTYYSPILTGSVAAFDSICGPLDIDSMRVYNHTTGYDTFFIADSFSVGGFSDGDSGEVCAWTDADCADYECLENSMHYCYSVFFEIADLSAEILEPIDLNGDSRVITTCDNQEIRWLLNSEHDIDEGSIIIEIEETEFTFPEDMHISGDTLIYEPPALYVHNDTINFCLLEIADTLGSLISAPVCGSFIVDLDAPEIASASPGDGDVIHSDSIEIDLAFEDDICDSIFAVDEITITSSVSDISEEAMDYPISIDGLEDGDTVRVCTIVSDGCADYCLANIDTVCIEFYVGLGEPICDIIAPADRNMDGRIISACDDMGFMLRLYDSHGMSDENIHFTVNDVDHYESDFSELFYDPDSTTIFGIFEPTRAWESGEWVIIEVDSAQNNIGDNLIFPAIDSFMVDTEGPNFIVAGIPDTLFMPYTTIIADVYDSICGTDINLDSMVIHIEPGGLHINRGSEWSDTTITGLSDGDVLEICFHASDACADTCSFNSTDTCLNTYISISEITAELIEPIDLNGDGRVISTCEGQQIRWLVSHFAPIDPSSIAIEVCGDDYDITDSELSLSGDTIIWNMPGYWSDGDSCSFSLENVCDTLGHCIESPASGDVIIDGRPPWLTDIIPETGGFMAEDTAVSFSATLYDSICEGEDFMDSLVLDIFTEGGHSHIVEIDLPTGDIGWSGMDSINCCIYLADDCADYCEPNDTSYCWQYESYSGAPIGEIVLPRDVNSDGRIISACSDQGVRFIITDPAGMMDTGIRFTVNGVEYTEADGGVSFADSATLIVDWLPSSPWPSGQVVDIALLDAMNIHGVHLASIVDHSYIIDTDAPDVIYNGPVGIVYHDSAFIQIDVEDRICDTEDIVIDSVIVETTVSGMRINFGNGETSVDTALHGFENGDIVTVHAWVRDGCADTCGFNDTLAIYDFEIDHGLISARVIPPIDTPETIISACDDQELRWFINSEFEIDESSIDGFVEEFSLAIDEPHLFISGDTMIFNPDNGFFESGVYEYCLVNLCDTFGACIDEPVCDSIIIDLDAPIFSMISPSEDISNQMPEISVHIADSISGLTDDGISMMVNGDSVSANWNGEILRFRPDYEFACGSRVDVCIEAFDNPHICDANFGDTCWVFDITCQPNIVAEDPILDPESGLTEGDSVLFSGRVSNSDIADIAGFSVGIYLNGELVYTYDIPAMAADTSDIVEYLIDDIAAGSHLLCLRADDGNTIDESNEYDNEICIEFTVSDALCDAHPNPFTPNGDGIYDIAIFEYPGMGGSSSNQIEIYDVQNRLIKSLGSGQKTWDGRDESGKAMPKGVYIYLVRDGDDVKCHGTIYIAR